MNMRGSMAMAMVCMAGAGVDVFTNSTINIPIINSSDNSTSPYTEVSEFEFNWDKSTRGVILSASLYSGFIAPFLGGALTHKFGAKYLTFIFMTAAGISCCLIPSMTRFHVYGMVALRFLIGFFTVSNLAAFQDIWSMWAPRLERVTLVAFSICGTNLANIFSAIICGLFCTIPMDNGWPFIFYLFGTMCLLWCVLWFVFVSNSPEEHGFISEEEKNYIMDNRVGISGKKKPNPPWKKMLSSRAVWAYIITQSCNLWCAITLFLHLPGYFNSILGFSISMTGVLLSIPFLCRLFGTLFWGYISDLLLVKSKLGVTKIRKLIQTTGFGICTVLAAIVTFIPPEYSVLAVIVVGGLLMCQGSSMASSAIIPLDIAPRFAGILTGLFIFFGSFLGVIAPMVTSLLVYGGRREVEWRIVFFMLCAFYVIGLLAFLIFGSAELQPWAVDAPGDNFDQETSDEDGISNITFEIESPEKYSPGGTKVNGYLTTEATKRIRTSSNNSSQHRIADTISLSLVQTSEIGTPELVMKFPRKFNISRSPLANTDQPQFNTSPQDDKVDILEKIKTSSPVLDVNTAVVPLESPESTHTHL